MADNSNIYLGYSNPPRISQRISFSAEDLDRLKLYLTEKGKVHLDVVTVADRDDNRKIKTFISVYDPNSGSEQKRKADNQSTDDVPF